MIKIQDPEQIQSWLEKGNIRSYFSTPNLNFLVYQYEKGEKITSPDKKLKEIVFITEGTIRIYGFRDNGTVTPVNQQTAPVIIGDIALVE